MERWNIGKHHERMKSEMGLKKDGCCTHSSNIPSFQGSYSNIPMDSSLACVGAIMVMERWTETS